MLTTILQRIFRRELLKLREEINSYTNEETIWEIENKISNSAGNLCLHLIGNLNTYIGAELGKSGYVRNRDEEFSLKGISKAVLMQRVDQTLKVVESTLASMSENDLQKEYPVNVFQEKMTTSFFLVHLASHLTYHLGQINYHRRLLDRRKKTTASLLVRGLC